MVERFEGFPGKVGSLAYYEDFVVSKPGRIPFIYYPTARCFETY
jgi:hypothetical protein